MDNLLEYKCPCCGGAIEFDSSLQQLKCPYCDTVFDVETLKDYDRELKSDNPDDNIEWDTSANSQWQEGETDGISVYVCNSCGGEIIADDTTGATKCPFCGNPVVMSRQFAGDLRPDLVIPFKLDKKAAKEKLMQHLSGKKLLPKLFKDENHIDEIKGIYVPFWLFDADANVNIRYKATKVRAWSDRNYRYVETSFFSVLRAGNIGFENIPADGSAKIADELMESIEPYDFSQAVDFQTAYLSGFLADRYDVQADDVVGRINERVKHSAEQAFSSTVNGYSSVVTEHSNIQIDNGKAKYALLPVWILNTTWQGNQYTFAMNGQTGKFVGNLPVDKKAYWKWFGGLTAIYGAAALAILALFYLL